MKNLFMILFLAASLLLSKISFAQNTNRDFKQILQTYYLYKDKDVVDKAIDFVNNTTMDYSRLNPIITGFFGAAFLTNEALKKDFTLNINRIEKAEFKQLFIFILSSNIDTLYSQTKISVSLNDMNWSSFFATGYTKYLDNIISHIPHMENRTDVNLFLAGASAKWSLCSNSKQNDVVNKYLNLLKDKNPLLKEILENEPQYFNEVIISILKKQKENGIWN
ncbi:hypothetical protein J7E50_01345 [Pedobacter sp. ISL-68]|uniref:hypothetical protein n=1 Tax=unclassified Pedobacter TaxID=2628915 RepID=UPI001BECDC24|nr:MULTISPECIES: hypothetical protein [unclassified Pedobacter]MBT2563400.1 hypothetical protein [Pedobacter sp. ISL-64]MBT2588845.1 hypothetical protein [Pedobacter sp. ISL-68]